jgi:hypothetical protein
MDEDIDRLLVSVRADTAIFARDVAEMRSQLDGPFGDAVERAGLRLENALARAVRKGKFGFEELKSLALAVMADIAAAAIRSGIGAAFGGNGGADSGGGSLGALASQLLVAVLGAPGRATGGLVAPNRAYRVGERGPELFVPTSSGRVEARPTGPMQSGSRQIRMNITINAPAGTEPQALARSSRQVARAVKQALLRLED